VIQIPSRSSRPRRRDMGAGVFWPSTTPEEIGRATTLPKGHAKMLAKRDHSKGAMNSCPFMRMQARQEKYKQMEKLMEQEGKAEDKPSDNSAKAPDGKDNNTKDNSGEGKVEKMADGQSQKESKLEKEKKGSEEESKVEFKGPPDDGGEVALLFDDGDIQPTAGSARLLKEIGGGDKIRKTATTFYTKFLTDQLLKNLRIEKDGPEMHGKRFGDWLVEKMGGEGTPSTDLGRENQLDWQHMRSYFSPQRAPARQGKRFELDECRVWMRLMFLAGREEGLDKHTQFWNWYLKFIKHYIDIYNMCAPNYAERDAAWSLKKVGLKNSTSDTPRLSSLSELFTP